jgi:small nuclear ribonucleoprotein E
MNIVLEETDELDMKRRTKKPLGKILLKGDNITCVMQAPA